MIDQRHEIPLTTAITTSAPNRGSLVESLYRECLSLFKNESTKTGTVTKQRSVASGNWVTAIVTDNGTGLFVQMIGIFDGEKIKEGPYLIFGKKFLEESKSPQLSNTAVKLWR